MMIVPLAAAALLWLLLSQTRSAKRLLRLVLPELAAKLVAVLLVVLALLVAVHGNLWAALCLFGASLWSLGRTRRRPADIRGSAPTAMIATDAAGWRVLAGRYAGTPLDALDLAACLVLRGECAVADPAGARLLEAYLDRRFTGWRPARDGDADPRRRRARFANEMTEDQAYKVLGLACGATRSEVVGAHRMAMKRWHPDQGGTAEQAARANEAKEVLLRRHG